jgi:DNA-binding MarR family transcriptional regulator
MAVPSGWFLVASVTNTLSLVTWGFPLLSLAVLSYCIEYYTRFKTYWRLYIVAMAFVILYPVAKSYNFWIYGGMTGETELLISTTLLMGTLIAAYASLQLMKFQKIGLGKTKMTVQALSIVGIFVPLAAGLLGAVDQFTAWYLIGYNLSVTSMVLIFLAIGKLTHNYIPHYRLLAYNSAKLGSILLLVDPILLNYEKLQVVGVGGQYLLRLVGVLTQSLSTALLLVTVVLLILEAQARGLHLIPIGEKKITKPMKYRLKKGYGYLILEENPNQSTEIFMEYVTHQHHGLMLTRQQPTRIRQAFGLQTTPILWMTNAKTDEKTVRPTDLERMIFVIKDFIHFDTDSIILLQRLDYLITENDFNAVLKFIHNLNDVIISAKCILIISLDPSTLPKEKLALLTQELEDLTNADKISLGEPLYSVLLFVHTENTRRKTPSFKSITRKFMITKTTARKRIYELESKGLLKILNQGRYKFLEVTDKGRAIVSSPVSIQGGEENEA